MNDHTFSMLAAGNLGLEAIHKWTEALLPVATLLVSLGQAAVAIVTVVYIVRKLKSKDEKNSPTDGSPDS
jgi:hypothetical protein